MKDDSGNFEASQEEGARKVGFSDTADYIDDGSTPPKKNEEVHLLVARGNKFSMHREGDMMADDDWGVSSTATFDLVLTKMRY